MPGLAGAMAPRAHPCRTAVGVRGPQRKRVALQLHETTSREKESLSRRLAGAAIRPRRTLEIYIVKGGFYSTKMRLSIYEHACQARRQYLIEECTLDFSRGP